MGFTRMIVVYREIKTTYRTQLFELIGGLGYREMSESRHFESLNDARRIIPDGAGHFPRSATDDFSIIETWAW